MGIIQDIKILSGKEEVTPSPVHKTPKKILITEDEEVLRSALVDRFTKEGYDVFKAANGEEGLAAAKRYHPDIILLDLLMPVLDGKVMLKRLRKIPEFKMTPVIVLTNAGEVDNIRETQYYDNAVEFLIKSNVKIDDVVERVNMLIL